MVRAHVFTHSDNHLGSGSSQEWKPPVSSAGPALAHPPWTLTFCADRWLEYSTSPGVKRVYLFTFMGL